MKKIADAKFPVPRAALLERIRSDVDVIGIGHWSVIDNTAGAPMVFKVSLSDDGKAWRTLHDTFRLDNVAENPVPQDNPLGATNTTCFVRLEALRTVKDGAQVVLDGLDLYLSAVKSGK